LLTMLLLNMFFAAIFTFALSEAEPQEQRILQLVMSLVRYIPFLVIIFMALPGIAAGIGLLAKQKWAMIVALIIGCLNLFSFPFGTALGIYTIWVYSQDQRQSKAIPA